MRHLFVTLTLLFSLTGTISNAADGQLLDRQPVALDPGKLLADVAEERRAALTSRLKSVADIELSQITYESDGLKQNRPEMEERVYSELVPTWKENREQALEARSALRWPEKLHKETPLLILHGTGDWRVNPMQALKMAEALYEARHPYRLMMFEGGDHGLSEFRAEVDRAAGEWLDRYVRDGEGWPSLEPHGR